MVSRRLLVMQPITLAEADQEVWRPVRQKGESIYEVSNQGRCRVVRMLGSRFHANAPLRVEVPDPDREDKLAFEYVYRLVAEAFLGAMPTDRVTLRDGDPDNAAVANLAVEAAPEPPAPTPPEPRKRRRPAPSKASGRAVPEWRAPAPTTPAGPPVPPALFALPDAPPLTDKPLRCEAAPGYGPDEWDRQFLRRDQVGHVGWLAHRWLIPPGRLADRTDPACGDHVCRRCGVTRSVVEERGLGRFNWKTGKNATLAPAPRAEARTW